MTPTEFITAYLRLESRISNQQVLVDTVKEQLDDLTAQQAELATAHLDDLTELRAGQDIEIASLNGFGNPDWGLPCTTAHIVEVMQADVADIDLEVIGDMAQTALRQGYPDIESATASLGIELEITVWVTKPGMDETDSMALAPHPGAQWRYPEAVQAVRVGGGKEAA